MGRGTTGVVAYTVRGQAGRGLHQDQLHGNVSVSGVSLSLADCYLLNVVVVLLLLVVAREVSCLCVLVCAGPDSDDCMVYYRT